MSLYADSSDSRNKSPEQYRGGSFYELDPAKRTMRGRMETIFKGVWNIEMDPELQAFMANVAATPSEADASKKIEQQARNVTATQAPISPAVAETIVPAQPGELNIDTIRDTIKRTAEPIGTRGGNGVAAQLPPEVVESIDLPKAPSSQYVGDNDGRLALGA